MKPRFFYGSGDMKKRSRMVSPGKENMAHCKNRSADAQKRMPHGNAAQLKHNCRNHSQGHRLPGGLPVKIRRPHQPVGQKQDCVSNSIGQKSPQDQKPSSARPTGNTIRKIDAYLPTCSKMWAAPFSPACPFPRKRKAYRILGSSRSTTRSRPDRFSQPACSFPARKILVGPSAPPKILMPALPSPLPCISQFPLTPSPRCPWPPP